MYYYNTNQATMLSNAYSDIFEVCTLIDKCALGLLKHMHMVLYREIGVALPLCNLSLRNVLRRVPFYRPYYWETYKALRCMRRFPVDVIWTILEHAGIMRMPSMENIYYASLCVVRSCGYLGRMHVIPAGKRNPNRLAYKWDTELIDVIVAAQSAGEPLPFVYPRNL